MPNLTEEQINRGVGKILDNIGGSEITISDVWEVVWEAEGVELWASTRGGKTITFKPAVAELKEWLENLFNEKGVDDYDLKICNGVDVFFQWSD
ncbi:Fc.00g104100.m01.CDS01 [Cosmosporella sp. VM-42]